MGICRDRQAAEIVTVPIWQWTAKLARASTKSWLDWVVRYAPLLTVLAAYFFLTVLMNVVFVLFDDGFAAHSISDFSIAAFPVQAVGYWLLLFLPFVLLPPVAILFQRILARPAEALAEWAPEFRPFDYLVITAICYGIVIHAMYRADAWGLLSSASDAISSVWARFELLDRLRFFERAILQSVLVFLTLYSLVYTLRWRKVGWLLLFAVNLVVMTVLLVSLNMKWPIVVLYGGIVACAALYGQPHRIIYTTIAMVAMVCVYLLVATVVLRIPSSVGRTVEAAASSSRFLAVSGLVRMALPYPFYYRTFTDEGPVCGTIMDRLQRRKNACQPSLLIYEKMFRDDGFAGLGTAPAAFHITGYALDGWLGAIIETVLAGAMIGGFMAVPTNASAISGTVFVMGILSAYFLSQLPFEGPIIYDHGLLWWSLLVLCYTVARHLFWPIDAYHAKDLENF